MLVAIDATSDSSVTRALGERTDHREKLPRINAKRRATSHGAFGTAPGGDDTMFDLDDFLTRTQEASAETEPRRAVREVLDWALTDPNAVADVLAPTEAGFTL